MLIKKARHHCRKGLSLIEVVVSSLLVGTVVVGALSTLGSAVRTKTVAADLAKGPALADAMLAEIMSMPYEDPQEEDNPMGLDTGEVNINRLTFDDVDDYQGWNPANVQDRQGNALPAYAGWSRSVTVTWAERVNGNIWFLYETGLKRIIVIVTAPDGTQTLRFGLRSKEGSLEQAPSVDTTVVTQLETNLTVGSSSNMSQVTNLLNHVEDPSP